MNAPCYKCPDRKQLCHSTCERYKAYAEERKKINDNKRKANDSEAAYYEVVLNKRISARNHLMQSGLA